MSTPAVTPSAPDSAAQPSVAPKAAAAAQGLSPERLDQVISTTKPRGWIALLAVFTIVVATLVWSIVATIPRQSSATGVVSSLAYTEAITATLDGIVSVSELTTGGKVKQGQKLGTITPFNGEPAVDITAPATGLVSSVGVLEGSGVGAGEEIARLLIPPDPAQGIAVITYLPAAVAATFTPRETATVSLTNLAQSSTVTAVATVVNVSSTPINSAAMVIQAGSEATADLWQQQAGGDAFRVVLLISSDVTFPANSVPQAGQLVEIVNPYSSVHPIELLFGTKQ